MVEKYTAVVRWSEPDEAFLAHFAELPDVLVHGGSREEALAELVVAATAALDVLAEDGRSAPPPHAAPTYSGQFRLRIPCTVHAKLADMAKAEGVSLNTLVSSMLSVATGGSPTAPWGLHRPAAGSPKTPNYQLSLVA